MFQKLFFFFLAGWVSVAVAQNTSNGMSNIARDMMNTNGLKVPLNANVGLFGIKGPRGEVVGNPYLDSTWQEGSIKLFKKIGPPGREGDSIANVPIRLDLYTNEVEIKTQAKEIRAVNGNMVRFFTIEGVERRVFMNALQFRADEPIQGFMELIAAGRISLVEYTKLNIVKPTYNEALGTGSRDTKIAKNAQFYAVKGNTLFQIGTSKKKLLEALGDRADDVEKYIKTNDLSVKSRADMGKIFAYYNSL